MEFYYYSPSETFVVPTADQHPLQIFRDLNFLGEDKLIFTMDITSLYTVIPNGKGLLALKHFFDLRTVKEQARKHCSAWLN